MLAHVPRVSLRLASQRLMSQVAGELDRGEDSWFTALGGSMRPALRSVQRVRLRPPGPGEDLLGAVVLVRVGTRWWLHRVVATREDEVEIAGDNGMRNGWTRRSEVHGVLVDQR